MNPGKIRESIFVFEISDGFNQTLHCCKQTVPNICFATTTILS